MFRNPFGGAGSDGIGSLSAICEDKPLSSKSISEGTIGSCIPIESDPSSEYTGLSSKVDVIDKPSADSSHFKSFHTKRQLSDTLMQNLFGSLSKSIRLLFVVYIFVSLVYTFAHFFTLFHPAPGKSSNIITDNQLASGIIQETHAVQQTMLGKIVLDADSDNKAPPIWTGHFSVVSKSDFEEGTKESNSIVTSNDKGELVASLEELGSKMIYSKLFQYSLQPSRIIPYFFKMNPRPIEDDVTITTLITVERLSVLNNLVNRYRGPISVTLHLRDDENKLAAIEQLHEIRRSSTLFVQFVDMHLVIDNFDRQFNLWRNIARLFARTEIIMAIDVDFMLCSNLRENIKRLSENNKQLLYNGSAVFVVPAFELTKEAAELDVNDYPSTKEALLTLIDRNEAVMFHEKWQRGHGPTNYDLWYAADSPYRVTEYNYNYEPYVLMRREGLPWCDERFVGYGANKAACLYEIFLSGAKFWVLPEDFLVHQRHPYPENDRRIERKYNKRLYDAYREEVCFRYSRMYQGMQNMSAVDERICGANFYL